MKKFNYILPIGSVVFLEGNNIPMLIVGVYKTVRQNNDSRTFLFDYAATMYPAGLNQSPMYYFNHENINQIIFRGMESDQFFKFLKVESEKVETALAQNTLLRGKIG